MALLLTKRPVTYKIVFPKVVLKLLVILAFVAYKVAAVVCVGVALVLIPVKAFATVDTFVKVVDAIDIVVRAEQLLKAEVPIEVTVDGIIIVFKEVQLWKRELLNVVIVVDCMVTDVRPVQP